MGYEIKLPEKFLQFNGEPFLRPKLDKKTGGSIPRKDKETGEVLKNLKGDVLIELEEVSFVDIAKVFVENAFNLAGAQSIPDQPIEKPEGCKPWTIDDIGNATTITADLNVVADNVLVLEDHPYWWLMGKDEKPGVIDLYGPHPLVLGINAQVFKDVFSTDTVDEDGKKTVTKVADTRAAKRRSAKKDKKLKAAEANSSGG